MLMNDLAGGGVFAELIVLSDPIALTEFHSEIRTFGEHFGTQQDQSICVISRFPIQDEDGRQITTLTLSRPELVDGTWKIRLLETHHYWSWLAINTGSNKLKGSFHATGYGGPRNADVQISRIGAPDIRRCIDAESEVIPPEYY